MLGGTFALDCFPYPVVSPTLYSAPPRDHGFFRRQEHVPAWQQLQPILYSFFRSHVIRRRQGTHIVVTGCMCGKRCVTWGVQWELFPKRTW